jgi:hypothetical protein
MEINTKMTQPHNSGNVSGICLYAQAFKASLLLQVDNTAARHSTPAAGTASALHEDCAKLLHVCKQAHTLPRQLDDCAEDYPNPCCN